MRTLQAKSPRDESLALLGVSHLQLRLPSQLLRRQCLVIRGMARDEAVSVNPQKLAFKDSSLQQGDGVCFPASVCTPGAPGTRPTCLTLPHTGVAELR